MFFYKYLVEAMMDVELFSKLFYKYLVEAANKQFSCNVYVENIFDKIPKVAKHSACNCSKVSFGA